MNRLHLLSLCGTALIVLALASTANAQDREADSVKNVDGELAPFLGNAEMAMKPLFDKQRFPNIVVTTHGTLLATFGQSIVTCRRSSDGGESWGPEIVIAKSGIHGGGTTVNELTGEILAFVEDEHPPARIRLYRSGDDGLNWVESPMNIQPNSLGHIPSMHMNEKGITIMLGKPRGRLIRPTRYYATANDRKFWPEHYTNAMFSDDGGANWQTSEPFPEMGTGEAAIVELNDGRLLYNSRVHWDGNPDYLRRRQALSHDGGNSWTDFKILHVLPDGTQDRSYGLMGGLTRLPVMDRDILVFSNVDAPGPERERATVWVSFDGGETWPMKRLVSAGRSAYSSIVAGRPGTPTEGWLYLHFEQGTDGVASNIAKFNLAWIIEGEATGDGTLPHWISN